MKENQTAVEWLQEAMNKKFSNQTGPSFLELFQRAKAMEKQQIADAYDYEADDDMHDYSSGEQYYEQTFL